MTPNVVREISPLRLSLSRLEAIEFGASFWEEVLDINDAFRASVTT
jgi:hypothetical protein